MHIYLLCQNYSLLVMIGGKFYIFGYFFHETKTYKMSMNPIYVDKYLDGCFNYILLMNFKVIYNKT